MLKVHSKYMRVNNVRNVLNPHNLIGKLRCTSTDNVQGFRYLFRLKTETSKRIIRGANALRLLKNNGDHGKLVGYLVSVK